MAPRIHNLLSYSLTAVIFACLAPWGNSGAAFLASLWLFHFARRSLEALFVHRYGKKVVPASDFIVEYVYYWGFAAWIAWSLRNPDWDLPSTPVAVVGSLGFLLGELGNAWAHQKLRALRKHPGEAQKSIPRGGLFNWISCPHYLFEIISWCGFCALAQSWASAAFALVGAGIVSSYALSRHRAYRAEFNGQDGQESYPSSRRAILPYLL